ncbi:hypothetical protein QWY75_10525 [Pontixanthobacter aestiaquae]|nr:hypothetical protein [Pontixanthobacter aestiaquae]MDN3646633.1 hypothetical protein [Pontixanthobacter aestiaquae]
MTTLMRHIAASLSTARKKRNALPKEVLPHHVSMAAIGVTAPEFI